MAFETTNGTGAEFRYGPIVKNLKAGRGDSHDAVRELTFTSLTGDNYADVEGILPAGARVIDVVAVTRTAGTLSTVGATLDIGVEGSVATNNVDILDTAVEAAGTYYLSDAEVTLNGTLAAQLTADTTLKVAPSAGTFTGGDIQVIIRYTVG